MGLIARAYDGSPCSELRAVGASSMGCVQVDCDGVHHYFTRVAIDRDVAV